MNCTQQINCMVGCQTITLNSNLDINDQYGQIYRPYIEAQTMEVEIDFYLHAQTD